MHISGIPYRGLLDSGAEVTVLGNGSEMFLENSGVRFYHQPSSLSTASGDKQRILGHIRTLVSFNGKKRWMRIFIAPGLTQNLYLGIDFWKLFNLAPRFVSSLDLNVPSYDPLPESHQLSSSESQRLSAIVEHFPSFAKEGLGKTHLLSHVIDVDQAKPIKQRFYPVSPKIEQELFQEIDRMLALGVIEESQSSWNNPVTMVSKSNGKKRFCLDARRLNDVTIKDAYGLPIIDGLLSRLKDTVYISAIDLKDAFWQIPLHPDSRDKTAFTVPGRPLYQFKVMPFGLCNAPQTMCKLMTKVIPHQLHDRIFVYLDDLLVISATFDEHMCLLEDVSSRLRQANLTINVEKSKFCLTYTRYLGYVVGGGRLQVDPGKVEAVDSFPIPKTARHVRRFLGMSGWYSRFIPNYASLATPLTDLLGKKKFLWSPDCQKAFEEIKLKLTSAPILVHPDFSRTFYIQCDASKSGIGSVLFQKDEKNFDHPIAYFSKKLNKSQRNYNVTELECYAAVASVKKFRPYIEGFDFIIITDHASLQWLMRQSDLTGRLARWSLKLQGFSFKIEYRKGKDNIVPDALSRTFSVDELTTSLSELSLDDVAFKNPSYLNLLKTVQENVGKTNLVDQNGKVYIRTASSQNQFRLFVPDDLIPNLLEIHHNAPTAGHLGVEKTFERLSRLYYWPKMYKTVKNFVKNCSLCKTCKAPSYTTRPPMGSFHTPELPWQRIFVDFLGPYPRSKRGYCYVMVILDHFSKFVVFEPLRSITSETAIDTIEKRIFYVFGVPEDVVSDNGKQFTSNKFKSFLEKFGVKHILTPKYSPQSNSSERVNRVILSAIRSYLKTDQRDWDLHLNEIGCAIRTAIHSSTGLSPNHVLFGRNIVLNGKTYDLLRELQVLGDSDVVVDTKMNFEKIRDDVAVHLKLASEKHSHTYNLRSKCRSFSVGQKVFVRNFVLSDAAQRFSAKLAPKFIKAIISEKIGNVAVRCVDESGKNMGVYHLKDIQAA